MKTENETKDEMINEVDELGLQIESELNEMYETGQSEWDIEDIRKVGKRTYDLIFDNYEDDEENGVETSHFSLLEKEDDIANLLSELENKDDIPIKNSINPVELDQLKNEILEKNEIIKDLSFKLNNSNNNNIKPVCEKELNELRDININLTQTVVSQKTKYDQIIISLDQIINKKSEDLNYLKTDNINLIQDLEKRLISLNEKDNLIQNLNENIKMLEIEKENLSEKYQQEINLIKLNFTQELNNIKIISDMNSVNSVSKNSAIDKINNEFDNELNLSNIEKESSDYIKKNSEILQKENFENFKKKYIETIESKDLEIEKNIQNIKALNEEIGNLKSEILENDIEKQDNEFKIENFLEEIEKLKEINLENKNNENLLKENFDKQIDDMNNIIDRLTTANEKYLNRINELNEEFYYKTSEEKIRSSHEIQNNSLQTNEDLETKIVEIELLKDELKQKDKKMMDIKEEMFKQKMKINE